MKIKFSLGFWTQKGWQQKMSRSKMSDRLKYEIAKELGVYDVVSTSGWGNVSSRDCGNIVTKAIEIAERSITK